MQQYQRAAPFVPISFTGARPPSYSPSSTSDPHRTIPTNHPDSFLTSRLRPIGCYVFRASRRGAASLRTRRARGAAEGGHYPADDTSRPAHDNPVPLLPQQTAVTEIATWAQSAQAAPPPLRRLALTLTHPHPHPRPGGNSRFPADDTSVRGARVKTHTRRGSNR